jgi:hypothetical protein
MWDASALNSDEAAQAQKRPDLATPYRAPQTDLEKTLTQVWQKVFGLGSVGLDDDFFDLGGHSLLAMHCLSQIRYVTGVAIPLRILFECHTIRGCAAYCLEHGATTQATGPSPVLPADAARITAQSVDKMNDADVDAVLELLQRREKQPKG